VSGRVHGVPIEGRGAGFFETNRGASPTSAHLLIDNAPGRAL